MSNPQDVGVERPVVADLLDKRADLLACLADGAKSQRGLREELDRSRSTVYKAVTELEEAGLVTEGADGYELTGVGRLAWRRHDAYRARLDRLVTAEPILNAIPADARVPLSAFEHGRVIVPGRHAPERPLDHLETRAEGADTLRCFSPAGMPRYFSDIHEQVAAADLTAKLVIEDDGIDRVKTAYDHFEAAVEDPSFDVRIADDELPFAVVVFDEAELGLFVYEDGSLAGAAFCDDEAVLTWGERLFERVHEQARPV
ncbi:helix-turn-helix transcriptional regulator [Natronomonas amylolytica]|uniref:helix-turn-helix transcriptional regulator n=1 Tax=Natronomonas amylolytica TaxID=3108498 RepID=UPI0030088EEC